MTNFALISRKLRWFLENVTGFYFSPFSESGLLKTNKDNDDI